MRVARKVEFLPAADRHTSSELLMHSPKQSLQLSESGCPPKDPRGIKNDDDDDYRIGSLRLHSNKAH